MLGSNELSRKSDDFSSRRKERVITARHFLVLPHWFPLLIQIENEKGGFPYPMMHCGLHGKGFFPNGTELVAEIAVMVCYF